jgi:hypothetical protein
MSYERIAKRLSSSLAGGRRQIIRDLPHLSYEGVVRCLPSSFAAQLELRRPRFFTGGPMNGQAGRQQIIRDLIRSVTFEQIIETGTFRGATTEFLAMVTGAPVATVELVDRYRLFAEARLAGFPGVEVCSGDSRTLLRRLSLTKGNSRTLFYLDAHWELDLPLAEELQIIAGAWSQAVIVIDDFEVPDDPGYGFDDYGSGKSLTAAYLPADIRDWKLYYPVVASSAETGARRGSAFLASPRLAEAVDGVPSLRKADSSRRHT